MSSTLCEQIAQLENNYTSALVSSNRSLSLVENLRSTIREQKQRIRELESSLQLAKARENGCREKHKQHENCKLVLDTILDSANPKTAISIYKQMQGNKT